MATLTRFVVSTMEEAGAEIGRLRAVNAELLAALSEVTAELHEFASITINGETDERMTGMVDRARAAIARATGAP